MKTNITKESKGLSITSRFFLVMLLACTLFLSGYTPSFATTVDFQWDAVANPELIIGYKVYYQADPFTGWVFHASVQNTQTNATISGLDPTHSYHIAVTSYDATSESNYSNIVYVPKLSTPIIAITSPINNASVRGDVSVVVSAGAEVSKIEFFNNDESIPFRTVGGASTFIWGLASDGSYILTAKAYDSAGNLLQSSSVTVIKDTVGPEINFFASIGSATASGMLTLTASAIDEVGVSRVEFYDNDILESTVTSAPYLFNWNLTAAAVNVAHTLMAKAYDAAGNIGLSRAVKLTVPNCIIK